MKALRFHRFGAPAELALEEVARPGIGPADVLVAVRAASVNPSDVKNVAGTMHGTSLPRTPGRDFAGTVIEGPAELVGAEVWGAGGEIGFERDGTHAEYVVLPAGGVSRKPERLDFAAAAACGVNFVTAFSGVHDALRLAEGETILVTGAGGGVGSSVVQLARLIGARTIGVERRAVDRPASLRPDVTLLTADDVVAEVLRETAGRGVDAVFDTVGAALFEMNLRALAERGRYAIIASAGERRASLDIPDFYHKRLQLTGVDSRKIGAAEAARMLDRLRPGFERGALQAPHVAERFDLKRAVEAYEHVARGAGKVVIEMP